MSNDALKPILLGCLIIFVSLLSLQYLNNEEKEISKEKYKEIEILSQNYKDIKILESVAMSDGVINNKEFDNIKKTLSTITK